MSTPLTIDDIAKLLQTTQKKPRKKIERTEEQTSKMKERLAMMREKSLQARQAKALLKPEVMSTPHPQSGVQSLEVKKLNEQDTEALFEKKYNSRFEKIDETMGEIKNHLSDIKELKKQKALEKAKAKEEAPRKEASPEVVSQVHHVIPQVNKVITNPNKVPKTIDYRNMFIRR
tara:strand:+ start:5318 stop:5839 length:522 start_codon:yes stop_codon:yes gene_type:complete